MSVIGRMIEGLYPIHKVPDFFVREALPRASPPSFTVQFPRDRVPEFLVLWSRGIRSNVVFRLHPPTVPLPGPVSGSVSPPLIESDVCSSDGP